MTEQIRMARHGLDFTDQEIRREVKRYKALGDETRLKMVRVLPLASFVRTMRKKLTMLGGIGYVTTICGFYGL